MSAEKTPIPEQSLPPEITETTTGETWNPVSELTETNIAASETPASAFSRAYEAVRNTDYVSNAVNHAKIWYHGAAISMKKAEIARLEQLHAGQTQTADRHMGRLTASDSAREQLENVRATLNITPQNAYEAQGRDRERSILESRGGFHQEQAAKTAARLIEAKNALSEFETNRDAARNAIAARFERKIADSEQAVQNIDESIESVKSNIEVGNGILQNLQEHRGVLRSQIDQHPELLFADKRAIEETMQVIDARMQKLQSAIQSHQGAIGQHTERRRALMQKTDVWRKRIVKKEEKSGRIAEPAPITETLSETADKTEKKIAEEVKDMTGSDIPDSQESAANVAEKIIEAKGRDQASRFEDFRRRLHAYINDPKLQELGKPEYLVSNGKASPEQVRMARLYRFLTDLDGFLESPDEPQEKPEKDIIAQTVQRVDRMLEDVDIDQYIGSEDIARIEKSGTKEENLISKLLQMLVDIFTSFEIFEKRDGKTRAKL